LSLNNGEELAAVSSAWREIRTVISAIPNGASHENTD
jgi:hypothetical protein